MNWEIKSWGENGNITYYHVQIEVTFDLTNWRSTSIPESKYGGGKELLCSLHALPSPKTYTTQNLSESSFLGFYEGFITDA